jgi:hypothetical protein
VAREALRRQVARLAFERASERSSVRREHRIAVLRRVFARAERALRRARQRVEHPRNGTVRP